MIETYKDFSFIIDTDLITAVDSEGSVILRAAVEGPIDDLRADRIANAAAELIKECTNAEGVMHAPFASTEKPS